MFDSVDRKCCIRDASLLPYPGDRRIRPVALSSAFLGGVPFSSLPKQKHLSLLIQVAMKKEPRYFQNFTLFISTFEKYFSVFCYLHNPANQNKNSDTKKYKFCFYTIAKEMPICILIKRFWLSSTRSKLHVCRNLLIKHYISFLLQSIHLIVHALWIPPRIHQ